LGLLASTNALSVSFALSPLCKAENLTFELSPDCPLLKQERSARNFSASCPSSSQICLCQFEQADVIAVSPDQVWQWYKIVGSFLERFSGLTASIHRYARNPSCQAISMTAGSTKLHAQKRESTQLFTFEKVTLNHLNMQ
jgi:hypothetical protein